MHAGQRAGRGKLDEHVAVGHGVHGVLRDARVALRIDEAERLGRELAVDGERGAGDGPGAKRAPVGVVGDVGEAAAVAVEHLHPGKKVVREKHRLCALEVRVAGDEHVAFALGQGQQGALGFEDLFGDRRAGVFEKEPHIRRHLVVSGAGGVELGRGGHALRERLLDVHVHVFELRVPSELAFAHLVQDRVEAGMDGVALLGRDEADVREHGRVGLAALDVERCQPMIERHGLAKTQHELGGTGRESTAPGDLG